MSSRLSPGLFQACANAEKTALAGGKIQWFSGTQPTSPKSPATGTLIAETTNVTFDPAVVNPDDSVSLKKPSAANWRFIAIAAGTIGWCRYLSAADDNSESLSLPRHDLSVSTSTGTGDVKLAKLTYAVGDEGVVQSASIKFMNGILPV